MQAIKALRECRDISVNFIIRNSYSSHANTIELLAEEARGQYIDNILKSDLSLAVRGDANISCRFYEILSLGRVPLFVDTDCVLPMENVVDYKNSFFTLIIKICLISARSWQILWRFER